MGQQLHDSHDCKYEDPEDMIMKYLAVVPVAIFSLALQAQTGSAANGAPQTKQVAAANVSAELTKRIDTKNAKQGDEVDARVTSTVKLPDGTELPRGTKLVGKVTDVKAKSKEDKRAHLAFSIDHAVLKGGKDVPVMVALTSVTGPAQSSASDMAMPGAGGGGGGAAAGGAGGGGMAGSSASAPSAAMAGMEQSQPNAGGVLKSAQDHVPVGNMPGVMLSAASNPGSAGSFDASGDNINLDSGTKLTLNMAASSSPAGQ
jgi:hypothetical protein